jgi:hypothetical protein
MQQQSPNSRCISLISRPVNPASVLCLPADLQVHEKMKKLQKKQDKGPDALNK